MDREEIGYEDALKVVQQYLSERAKGQQGSSCMAFQLGAAESMLAMLISGEMTVERLRANVLGA